MIQLLKNIAYFGGILLTILGLVLILIVNETGHSPEWLVKTMTSILFLSGFSIFIVIIKRGMHN